MSIIADLSEIEEQLHVTSEVAVLFRVDPDTVARWVARGQLPAIRTPGGQLRFRHSVVLEALNNPAFTASNEPPAEVPA